MPRPIGTTFGDLIGKLDVIVVEAAWYADEANPRPRAWLEQICGP